MTIRPLRLRGEERERERNLLSIQHVWHQGTTDNTFVSFLSIWKCLFLCSSQNTNGPFPPPFLHPYRLERKCTPSCLLFPFLTSFHLIKAFILLYNRLTGQFLRVSSPTCSVSAHSPVCFNKFKPLQILNWNFFTLYLQEQAIKGGCARKQNQMH